MLAATILAQLCQFVWSQASIKITDTDRENNMLNKTAVRYCSHFVTFFVYQIIQFMNMFHFFVCKNSFYYSMSKSW